MMRFINIVFVLAVIATATWTYGIKHQADEQVSAIAAIKKQIETEHETIELLKADWALLSQPSRLQKLAERYKEDLKLDVTGAHQIASPEVVPIAPERTAPLTVEEILAGSGSDPMATGSVQAGDN